MRLFPLPEDAVLGVPLTHSELPWFGAAKLRWRNVTARDPSGHW
ncbi:nitric oxide synthase oxygenase [Allosaccharopolyspora coralli]|nr:nitric oxide synthase oxygenase [Allosaccharopolyspora coralli]